MVNSPIVNREKGETFEETLARKEADNGSDPLEEENNTLDNVVDKKVAEEPEINATDNGGRVSNNEEPKEQLFSSTSSKGSSDSNSSNKNDDNDSDIQDDIAENSSNKFGPSLVTLSTESAQEQ